jgi:hypothetical protein
LKVRIFILAGIALLAALTMAILQPDPSVEGAAFRSRFQEALRRGGYNVDLYSSYNAAKISLPPSVRWHPRRWHAPKWDSGISMGIGIPRSAERYGVRSADNSGLDCFVRYLDDCASFIEIHSRASSPSSGPRLRSTLAEAFPGMPIRYMDQ